MSEVTFEVSESHYGRRDRSVPRSAGNVIYVSRVRVRPRPLVFLERVALLEGKLADAPATGKPSTRSPLVPIVPTVPTAEAGNVGKLSSAGERAVVRVVDACREPDTEDRWRVTIADDGEADARSCLCAAGVSACGVKPKSLVSVGTAGSADLDGVSTLVITSLSVVAPPPATAPTAGDSCLLYTSPSPRDRG